MTQAAKVKDFKQPVDLNHTTSLISRTSVTNNFLTLQESRLKFWALLKIQSRDNYSISHIMLIFGYDILLKVNFTLSMQVT